MILKKKTSANDLGILTILALMLLMNGIAILLFNLIKPQKTHYPAAALSEVSTVLRNVPYFQETNSGKYRNRQYIILPALLPCYFVIKHAALSVLYNSNHYDTLTSRKAGDTVNIIILAEDKENLNYTTEGIPMLGCSINGQIIFTPDQILRWENKETAAEIKLCLKSIVAGIILGIIEIVRFHFRNRPTID